MVVEDSSYKDPYTTHKRNRKRIKQKKSGADGFCLYSKKVVSFASNEYTFSGIQSALTKNSLNYFLDSY